MKKLELLGTDGVLLGIWPVNVTGPDFHVDFVVPIMYPLRSISLKELKEDEATNQSQDTSTVED